MGYWFFHAEYFIPFSFLNDKNGFPIDLTATIGFDVTVTDRDPDDLVRNRMVWANEGAIDESWNNMDDCGLITFDGAESQIYVEEINISGGSITEDNQTLQITAHVLPENATFKN
ncbi:MAG: hypothetical protein IPF54_14515 [Draconibacterium sp.]|nr:hypothetical protein [Draconibacterium sp.]